MTGLVFSGRNPGDGLTVRDIPKDAGSREFVDFRDRAAYVHLTGTFPTHVRKYFTGLLRAATEYARAPLVGKYGHVKVSEDVVNRLKLDDHPMVRKVRSMMTDEGYVLRAPDNLKERRPFSRINLVHPKSGKRIIVQSDGSIRDDE